MRRVNKKFVNKQKFVEHACIMSYCVLVAGIVDSSGYNFHGAEVLDFTNPFAVLIDSEHGLILIILLINAFSYFQYL